MASIMEMFRRSIEQPAYNGVRHTRWAIIRNTYEQLKTTVLPDILQYLGEIAVHRVQDKTIRLDFKLPDGTRVRSDWLLMPLDTPQDVRRLLSMQLTGAWVNECREVPFGVLDGLLGRVGRFPSKAMGGSAWCGILMDTNPWDVDSPYHDAFVLNPMPKWALFHQPSGIGPHAENRANLRDGYYEDLMNGRDTDWSAVHIESQFGTSNAGQAVFRRSFNAQVHVDTFEELVINPGLPVMIMMDFGRTPSALLGQTDSLGRLIIYQEVVTEDMGLIQMIQERLKPVLNQQPWANRMFFVVADPAGRERSQYTEDNAFSILKDEGFLAYPAPTNDINPRIRAVEKRLLMSVQGKPGLIINRALCPTLVQAMGAKYRYKRKQNGGLDDLPEKTHPWSDVVDCLQYGCLALGANLSARAMHKTSPKARMPAPSVNGWT
jgi:hypothetical protein